MNPINPIEHVVIIVKENHTFDNYFGTYPGANGDATLAHAPDPRRKTLRTITGPGWDEQKARFANSIMNQIFRVTLHMRGSSPYAIIIFPKLRVSLNQII